MVEPACVVPGAVVPPGRALPLPLFIVVGCCAALEVADGPLLVAAVVFGKGSCAGAEEVFWFVLLGKFVV